MFIHWHFRAAACLQRRLPRDAAGVKRISGCICHTEASTGRLAMTNVNLQNVPKPADFQVPATQTAPSQLPELLHRMHTANIRCALAYPTPTVPLFSEMLP